jgi:heat-inducible transcriptional repressor
VQPIDANQAQSMSGQLQADAPSQVVSHAASLLSSLSSFAGVVCTPRRAGVFRHIEFLRLGDRRLLLILVTPDGDVLNKVFHVDQDYLPEALIHAGNYLTANYAGLSLQEVRNRLHREIADLRQDVSRLMLKAVEEGGAALSDPDGAIVISGERRLLDVSELSEDMGRLRQLFDLFEKKTSLAKLLEFSERAQGVKIYIGGESNLVPVDELSVITAPYQVNGRIVGTLGVIGPTRMAYDRVIPIVDITARLVSTALTHLAAESGPQADPSGAGA